MKTESLTQTNQISLQGVMEKLWILLRNAPLQKNNIDFEQQNRISPGHETKISLHAGLHLHIILYRYGHELLRHAQTGKFRLYFSFIPTLWSEEYINIKFIYKITLSHTLKNKKYEARTPFPQRLIAMHMARIGGLMFQTHNTQSFFFPRRFLEIG